MKGIKRAAYNAVTCSLMETFLASLARLLSTHIIKYKAAAAASWGGSGAMPGYSPQCDKAKARACVWRRSSTKVDSFRKVDEKVLVWRRFKWCGGGGEVLASLFGQSFVRYVTFLLHCFKRLYFSTPQFCKGVFTVLEAEWQHFHIINRRNTLENPAGHLCGLGKHSWWERERELSVSE